MAIFLRKGLGAEGYSAQAVQERTSIIPTLLEQSFHLLVIDPDQGGGAQSPDLAQVLARQIRGACPAIYMIAGH